MYVPAAYVCAGGLTPDPAVLSPKSQMYVKLAPVDALALKVTAKPVFEKVKLATGPVPISTVADAGWPPASAATMVSRSVVRKVRASPFRR